MSQAKLIVSLALNVISSVGVIFINKRLVFMAANYPFGTALTIIHFIVCFLGCLFFARIGYFEIKKLELKRVSSISFAFCGYVVFNNLSLLTNSVAIYQISKILCTPVIVGIEYFFHGKKESQETLMALVPVCLGIFVAVYTDPQMNAVGTFWAVLAIIANSLYTIWGKTKTNELGVTPMQILTYQAPMSAVILIFALPLMDPVHDLVAYRYSAASLTYIFISCVFAFGVNFSFFLFVGQTSPLTMNVVGYLKTCLVFMGGFIFFDTEPTVQNVVGIALTMFGVGLYSKSKLPKPEVEVNKGNAV